MELTYRLKETAKLRGGYVRTAEPVALYKYFGLDRAYLRFSQLMWGRTSIEAALEYQHLGFGKAVVAPNTPRTDHAFAAELTVAHSFKNWLTLALVERFELRRSDYRSPDDFSSDYTHNDLYMRLSCNLDALAAAFRN
jgi:hypothetical protein